MEPPSSLSSHKPSPADILAEMGVDALPPKAQDPLLVEIEARYEAECEKVRVIVFMTALCGLGWVGLGWLVCEVAPIGSINAIHRPSKPNQTNHRPGSGRSGSGRSTRRPTAPPFSRRAS